MKSPYFTSVARNSHLNNKPEANRGLISTLPSLSISAQFYGYLRLLKATREAIERSRRKKDLQSHLGIKLRTPRIEGHVLTNCANPSSQSLTVNDRLRTKFKVAKTKNWPLLSASSFGPVQIGGPLIYELLVASCCFFVVKVQSFFHIKSSTVFITDNLTRDDELYVAEHQVLSSQIGVAAVVYNGLLSTFFFCLFVVAVCCCFLCFS